MDKFGLEGKNVVITGGCGLIGFTLVEAFAKEGANIACLDLPHTQPETKCGSVTGQTANKVIGYSVDVSALEALTQVSQKVLQDLGGVDILINSVQYKPKGFLEARIETFPPALWDDIISVNLTGKFYACQLFGNIMIKQNRGGKIINFASTYAEISSNPSLYADNKMGNPIAYTASKGGVISMSKYLAIHWAPHNIQINCLSPHGVYNYQEEAFVNRFSNLSPAGRMMRREEVVGAAFFLATDASSYVTGINLKVDGGWSAW
jgi:NAD(P)-dependent dehydrogenase (short-subunit alcohol dehydrogenase family)